MHLRNQLSTEQLFHQYIDEISRKACVTLTTLAVILFPAFSLLDYVAQRPHFETLTVIRFSTVFILFILMLLLRRGYLLRRPFITGTCLLMLSSLSITSMCFILGGSSSPYYAGVNLVVLGGVLILPYEWRRVAFTTSLIIIIYAVGMVIREGFSVQATSFTNNMYFLCSTGIIGVTAAYMAEKMRRESFFRSLEISRSIEVLQAELKSSHRDMEALAHEIVSRKSDAQDALVLRDGFISMASHELKTPLTALKLHISMARRKYAHEGLTPEETERLITSSDYQTQRVVRIVDDMLNVSRIQSGKFEIEMEELELSKLVKSTLESYFPTFLDSGLLTVDAQEACGFWDPYKMEQVVLNLVNNAIRYGDNKQIHVSARKLEDRVQLSVKDNGMGIPPQDQQRIFEKFERGRASAAFGGLGLGLYICKEIVVAHGGSIELVSEVGKGSEFIVNLPLSKV